MIAAARSPLRARFGWGIALPAALLLAFVILLTLSARGREWAPAVALVFGIMLVPGVMLANAWLLFMGWPRRWLLLAGCALPAYVAAALALLVHGSRGEDNPGAWMLAPFFALLESPGSPGMAALSIAWVAAMAALVVAAMRRERRLAASLLQ